MPNVEALSLSLLIKNFSFTTDDIVFASSVASTYLKQGYELLQNIFLILEQLYDSSSPKTSIIKSSVHTLYLPRSPIYFRNATMLSIRFIQELHALEGHALASFLQLWCRLSPSSTITRALPCHSRWLYR